MKWNGVHAQFLLALHDEHGGAKTVALFLVILIAFLAAAGGFSLTVTDLFDRVTSRIGV
jgi:hypothetical protein